MRKIPLHKFYTKNGKVWWRLRGKVFAVIPHECAIFTMHRAFWDGISKVVHHYANGNVAEEQL